MGSEQCSLRKHRAREQPRRNKPRQGAPSPSFPPTSSGFPVFCSAGCVSLLPVWCVPVPTGAVSFPFKKTTFAKRIHRPPGCPAPPPLSSGFTVLFCRLYFAATSGVCLIRSGAAGFPKKLHLHSQPKRSNQPNPPVTFSLDRERNVPGRTVSALYGCLMPAQSRCA